MKLNFTSIFLSVLAVLSIGQINAQEPAGGGEFKFNEAKSPCLTDEQRTMVLNDIRDGIGLLKSQNCLAYNEYR